MVAPVIYGAIALGGLYLGGKTLREAGQAAESGAKLAAWGTAAGALFVSYRALQAGGVLK